MCRIRILIVICISSGLMMACEGFLKDFSDVLQLAAAQSNASAPGAVPGASASPAVSDSRPRDQAAYSVEEVSYAAQKASERKTVAPVGLAVTWKNKYGDWLGAGPTQNLWSAYPTEKEALELCYNTRRGTASFLGYSGKYRVYNVGYRLEGGDRDIRKRFNLRF